VIWFPELPPARRSGRLPATCAWQHEALCR
jgi:hypothetical protein